MGVAPRFAIGWLPKSFPFCAYTDLSTSFIIAAILSKRVNSNNLLYLNAHVIQAGASQQVIYYDAEKFTLGNYPRVTKVPNVRLAIARF